MELTHEQKIWKERHINRLLAAGLSRELAEDDFHAGYFENDQCTIDLTDDPEGNAEDELSYMSEG